MGGGEGGKEMKEGNVRMKCLTCNEGKEWQTYGVNSTIIINYCPFIKTPQEVFI